MWRRRRPTDDEFRQEIEGHIAIETDRLIAEGLRPEEAARAARRTFGNVTLTRERFYEARRFTWLDDLGRDVRHTLRSLRRSPGFAAVAILTLAVGLGANTAVFGVVSAVLLRPLPYTHPEGLVLVQHPSLSGAPDWLRTAWRARAHTLGNFTAFEQPAPATLVTGGEPMQVEAAQVSANFFSLLGASPAAGTFFSAAESPTGPGVAVLTYRFWSRQFNRDLGVLGRTMTLTGIPTTVVGITKPDFRFPTPALRGPAALFGSTQPDVISLADSRAWLTVIGRLAPGSTEDAASADLQAIFRQEARHRFSPSFVERASFVAAPLRERLVGDARSRLLLLMGAVGCVLLVVCANIASLLLARVFSRQREYGVRAALGASVGRLARFGTDGKPGAGRDRRHRRAPRRPLDGPGAVFDAGGGGPAGAGRPDRLAGVGLHGRRGGNRGRPEWNGVHPGHPREGLCEPLERDRRTIRDEPDASAPEPAGR